MTTIELARFRVEDAAVDRLVAERPAMVEAMRRRFPGCLAAYLTREDDGGWLDVVLWRSRAEAEEAARLIDTVPECAAWFRHISASSGLRHVEVVDAWPDPA
ncbi:hypothetical protein Amsp01_076540 [Amycolatopsis sp. NBRC 101858]|uniref:antibiotic biosynthesis monooxygenase n=1 Tax=Amycolatopsis sp. NBRC 101858 TaxID=3032200 RepID=UPI0024A2FA3E|nr:antibiotic biosynthesis monooxygenase [Amycolatopsis sp. NBRC 101858]GLY41631.1 hypothetical protein Amsp01_076540 [Amycolatopsis sp. NBRC 101858]